ncbi:hypothetical protein [Lysobacter arvi]|uniref:Lipoprotein n=1 Tax=Lysobacter arvi TaxID=3038776 RepID=A0ABU1CEA6_9GAMM|nr:hypothetical protein [Lysobacter arvi]MDR0182769.1 hypothetical protein [Lysobacter arvi]
MPHRAWMLCMALLAGCAMQPPVDTVESAHAGQVGMNEISALIPQPSRVELAENESFLMPLEDDANPMPAYPAPWLSKRLPPQAVCVRVGVDRDGSVLSSAPAIAPPNCPEPADPVFFATVREAVTQWRYDPALRCVFPDARTREHTVGSCGGYTEVPEAVTLTYRFVFEQKDGRGSVRLAR